MSEQNTETDTLIPGYVNLLLKIKGGHLGVSTLGSDNPNMWLEATTDGQYYLNLENGQIDEIGGGSPSYRATINVDRSSNGLPFVLIEKYKGSFVLRILCTCEDKFFEDLASSIRSDNIPTYASFRLSPNPYLSESKSENLLPPAIWESDRSDPIAIHKQGFTYKNSTNLAEIVRTATDDVVRTSTFEEFSSIRDQILYLENQFQAMKNLNAEWQKQVVVHFRFILFSAILFILIFSILM